MQIQSVQILLIAPKDPYQLLCRVMKLCSVHRQRRDLSVRNRLQDLKRTSHITKIHQKCIGRVSKYLACHHLFPLGLCHNM